HGIVTADVSLFDNDGQLLVSLAGITMKQVSTDRMASWLYTVDWRQTPLPKESSLRKENEQDATGSWLVFAADHIISEQLISNLRTQRQIVHCVRQGDSFLKSQDDFEVDPTRA